MTDVTNMEHREDEVFSVRVPFRKTEYISVQVTIDKYGEYFIDLPPNRLLTEHDNTMIRDHVKKWVLNYKHKRETSD